MVYSIPIACGNLHAVCFSRLAVRHLFVVYREDSHMLRLQPKLKSHMWVLSLYLMTVA